MSQILGQNSGASLGLRMSGLRLFKTSVSDSAPENRPSSEAEWPTRLSFKKMWENHRDHATQSARFHVTPCLQTRRDQCERQASGRARGEQAPTQEFSFGKRLRSEKVVQNKP